MRPHIDPERRCPGSPDGARPTGPWAESRAPRRRTARLGVAAILLLSVLLSPWASAEVLPEGWELQTGASYSFFALPTLRFSFHPTGHWGLEGSAHVPLGVSAAVRYFASPAARSTFHAGAGFGIAFATYTFHATVGWRTDLTRRAFLDLRAGGARLMGTPSDDDWDVRATRGYVAVEVGWRLGAVR